MAKSIFEVLGAKCYVINVQPNGFNTNICSRTAVVSVVSGPDISLLKVCIHRGWYSYQKAEAEVELNKLNCIMGANPLYYSYGIADYFFGGF